MSSLEKLEALAKEIDAVAQRAEHQLEDYHSQLDARLAIHTFRQLLTSAGYTIERGWCDDMSLAETPSPSPLMGSANGVQFLMTWSPGSARLNAAFKDAFGQQAKESPDHPPGWYAWAKGLRCYTLDGKPIQVHPTHWRPIAPPNGGE